jgi:hypothetical protein
VKKQKKAHQFCQDLLVLGSHRTRAMTNLVMSLASSPQAQSPVDLSASEFCHYHYSNLTKVLEFWELKEDEFLKFLQPYFPAPRLSESGLRYYAITHDLTKMLKPHSPCLADRQYVPTANNVIPGNRSLGVGYPVSALHLGIGDAGWCPPLSLQRLSSTMNANDVAVQQIKDILQSRFLPFGDELCLSRTDSAYGKAKFISPLYEIDNLLLITRFRGGMKVWFKAEDSDSSGGAPRIYGKKFYLTDESAHKTYHKKGVAREVWQDALCEQVADDEVKTEGVLGNQRKVIFCVKRWNNLLIRTKQGASMKDKPFDMLRIIVLDAQTQERVFDRPLFVGVCGKRKEEIGSNEVQKQYRERYDVEPSYGFSKNRLLLDKLQTPCDHHLDKWIRIVQLTSWLLYVASDEIGKIECPVWQKYLPANKKIDQNSSLRLTIAQTQRSIHLLFSTLDKTPFLPLKCKKGKGRKTGDTFIKKTRYVPVKKVKKSIIKLKNQQNV